MGRRNSKASDLSKKLENTKVVYVADRESDTFHCLYEARKQETHCDVVIRSTKTWQTLPFQLSVKSIP
jgi:hypothetical protein